MTATKKLYRVVMEHRYNGGCGRDEWQSEKVLYCGYDEDEARRVYHAQPKQRGSSPGSYYSVVKCYSRAC